MTLVDENTCEATVRVQVSPTFFGWLAQFGKQMEIMKPESVAARYTKHIKPINR